MAQPTTVSNKWLKTAVLNKDGRVKPHIPKTMLYSKGALRGALAKMDAVILKPVSGTGGNGVVLVQKGQGGYDVRHRVKHARHRTPASVIAVVERIRRGRPYLIQQAVQLATIQGRPVDYRVKLVEEQGRWVVRAIVGRWARPGLFITNLCSGGTQLPAREALRRSLSAERAGPLKRRMRDLAYASKGILTRHYPGVKRLGFDFGVDAQGGVWLLEVNTNPH